jgi:hypothetical protein
MEAITSTSVETLSQIIQVLIFCRKHRIILHHKTQELWIVLAKCSLSILPTNPSTLASITYEINLVLTFWILGILIVVTCPYIAQQFSGRNLIGCLRILRWFLPWSTRHGKTSGWNWNQSNTKLKLLLTPMSTVAIIWQGLLRKWSKRWNKRCSNWYWIVAALHQSHGQWPPCHASTAAVRSLIVRSGQDQNRAVL